MKNYFLIFVLLVLTCSAFAQQDTTTIFSNPGYNNDPLRATWNRKITRTDSSWMVSLFNKKDVLQEQISYADQALEIRKGPYAFYEDGILKEEGNYAKGYKMGNWKNYNASGKLKESINYFWGKLNGKYQSYWQNGNVKSEGMYSSNRKVGNWKLFYADKKAALAEDYNDQGKLIDGVYFDESGNTVKASYIKTMASYPGGINALYDFLAKEIRYPTNAQRNKIEGSVKLAFTVLQDGSLTDVSVIDSPDQELSREALRVISRSKRWIPAQELGEPISSKLVIPVKFHLTD